MYWFDFSYKITKIKIEKKKRKKNNQPHGQLWLVEHKNCHREFVFNFLTYYREWNFLPITNCHVKPLNSCSTFKATNYKKPCII